MDADGHMKGQFCEDRAQVEIMPSCALRSRSKSGQRQHTSAEFDVHADILLTQHTWT